MGMFSQNELLLMIGVVSVLLLCISILTILDLKEYLKAKRGLANNEAFDIEEEKIEPITVTEVLEEEASVAVSNEEKNETAYFEEMDDEHFDVKPELNPIVEEEADVYVPQVENYIPQEEKSSVEVEVPSLEVNSSQVDVKPEKKKLDVLEELEEIENNLPNKKDDVTNFEAEQERTAIISLDELMKKSNELYNDNEIAQYDDGNEPISIDEVIKMFKKEDDLVTAIEEEKEVPVAYQEVVEEKVPYSKKETIPFISSVYGIEKDNNALEFENTATYEKLDREKYDDFVTQLKEMNENK